MAEIAADPRLGAKRRAILMERAHDSFVKHVRLLIRQAMQDGVLPGQTKLSEEDELAALELREQQLIETFQTPASEPGGELVRLQAGAALARLEKLRDGRAS